MKDTRQDLQKNTEQPQDYVQTLIELKQRIREAQYRALRSVNRELIELYWDIGRTIVEKQKADPDSWGRSIEEKLSNDLHNEFPETKGFSSRNIWHMRNFFLEYIGNQKLKQLVSEIPWGHNILIMQKCKDDLEREFYLKMCKERNWSRKELRLNIMNNTYENILINQTNFSRTLTGNIEKRASILLKDEYHLGFLNLNIKHSEKQLEQAIISKLPSFLRELGGDVAFAGSQYRLEIDKREFFVDLLLFHLKLNCLLVIELKTTEFKPEYLGKMLLYIGALEELEYQKDINPPIGIILCKSKNRTIVEYTLKKANAPIGVSNYTTVQNLPKDLKPLLPSKEQIAALLEGFDQ